MLELWRLLVSFSADVKAILKSGIGAIWLNVIDLFEDVVRVCGIEIGKSKIDKNRAQLKKIGKNKAQW